MVSKFTFHLKTTLGSFYTLITMLDGNKYEHLEWIHMTDLTTRMILIRIMYSRVKNGKTLLDLI